MINFKNTLCGWLRTPVYLALVGWAGQGYGLDIKSYEVELGQQWVQSGTTAPAIGTGNAYTFQARVEPIVPINVLAFVNSVAVKTPLGASHPLEADASGEWYGYSFGAPSASVFNALYSLGEYSFALDSKNDGKRTLTLSLAGGQYPVTPRISNLAAGQTIDPEQDFDLQWDAFGGAGADDLIRLVINDDTGSNVIDTGAPTSDSSPLAGTETRYTISSGNLESGKTYTATLTFYKVVQKQSADMFETGWAILSKATRFTLHAGTGGGDPTTDTTPPTLVASSPANGATSVQTMIPMILQFSEAMAPKESVAWSANIDLAKVSYQWMDSKTLLINYAAGSLPVSAWPANATVTWKLNPTAGDANNFQDVAGNPLAAGQFFGAFSTGSSISTNTTPGGDTNAPCQSQQGSGNALNVSKMVGYLQTGPSTTAIDPEAGASFMAMVTVPAAANMTAAKLTTPGGSTDLKVTPAMPPYLTNAFAILSAQKASQAELDQAFPAGNYTVQIAATPAGSGTVVLTTAYPPVPRIANYAATQTIDPAADFTLQWDGFAGAAQYDGISLSIMGDTGTVFQAPNECATPKVELAVTATSIVVPKGTLAAGKTYTLDLSFYHMESHDVPVMTGVTGFSSLSKSTTLTVKTTGGTPALTAPNFNRVRRASAGTVELEISCLAQRPLVIESSVNLRNWQPVLTTNAPAASLIVVLPAGPNTFFRAGQQ